MAVLIPNDKCLIVNIVRFFPSVKNAAGYYPGPDMPSTADGALLDTHAVEQALNFLRPCLGSLLHVFL